MKTKAFVFKEKCNSFTAICKFWREKDVLKRCWRFFMMPAFSSYYLLISLSKPPAALCSHHGLSPPQLCWRDKSVSDPTLQNTCLAFLPWGRAQVSFTGFLRPSHVHWADLWRPGSSQASQSLTFKCWAPATSHWWAVLILWWKWKELPHCAACLPLQLSLTHGQVNGPGVSSGSQVHGSLMDLLWHQEESKYRKVPSREQSVWNRLRPCRKLFGMNREVFGFPSRHGASKPPSPTYSLS